MLFRCGSMWCVLIDLQDVQALDAQRLELVEKLNQVGSVMVWVCVFAQFAKTGGF